MLKRLLFLNAIALSTLCILSLSPVPTALRTLAQTLPSQTPEVMPPLDPDDKPPTLPAGPRDECLTGENSPSLIPLLPDLNQKIGLTVSPHPSIFVYIPQTRAETALFVLIDEQRDRIYSQPVALAGTPGILNITVPEDANIPPLEPNQTYSWTLALLCPTIAGFREPNIYVTGRIQRVENPELAQQVSQAIPQQVPSLSAQAGIWHDTLHTLAQLRRENPQDTTLIAYWESLLTDVGLADIAQAPLLPLLQVYVFIT
ncbi:DUF928 domain-containing protein [Laspinema sp. A4]|uniref:DUF928 domain-containing protein n=1 Tax=Laspinema sp. D2d TaxID=2953686 RepID=UPI0021BB0484|nr:DUF928 domain-containing protein [Laspinema sp. D2d]MCT7986597.1 DUF928 domain-containing protein [Laspinema sp. D2d]